MTECLCWVGIKTGIFSSYRIFCSRLVYGAMWRGKFQRNTVRAFSWLSQLGKKCVFTDKKEAKNNSCLQRGWGENRSQTRSDWPVVTLLLSWNSCLIQPAVHCTWLWRCRQCVSLDHNHAILKESRADMFWTVTTLKTWKLVLIFIQTVSYTSKNVTSRHIYSSICQGITVNSTVVWVITLRKMVWNRYFRATYWSHVQESSLSLERGASG